MSITKWVEHLLKVNRDFANDPMFAMIATNIYLKHQALTLGNLYYNRKITDLTTENLKEMLDKGDFSILKSMYCFSSNIPGTQQFFSSYNGKAINFLRHTRISTNDEEMFNLFLTFSCADIHERALHEKLPKEYTQHYLDKILVKNLNSIPDDADPSDYITESEDYRLRMKAINENSDIVNAYFNKKVELIFKHVLKPIFGATDYIARYEFQNRGTIHCHMIIIIEKVLHALTWKWLVQKNQKLRKLKML